MKKSFTILLMLIYSLSTFGIGLEGIFCCEKLKAIKVTMAAVGDENLTCHKSHEHKQCCKTKIHYFKANDRHLVATATSIIIQPSTEIHSILSPLQLTPFSSLSFSAKVNGSHSPPLHNGIPIHIFNCLYKI